MGASNFNTGTYGERAMFGSLTELKATSWVSERIRLYPTQQEVTFGLKIRTPKGDAPKTESLSILRKDRAVELGEDDEKKKEEKQKREKQLGFTTSLPQLVLVYLHLLLPNSWKIKVATRPNMSDHSHVSQEQLV